MWPRGEPTRVVGDSEKRLWTVCKCVLGPSVYEARGGPVSSSNMALAGGLSGPGPPSPVETEGQMDKTRKLLGQNTRESGGVRGGAERQGVPQPHIRKTQAAPWGVRDSSLGCLGRGRNGLNNRPQLLSAQIPTPPLRLSLSHFTIPRRGWGVGIISPT